MSSVHANLLTCLTFTQDVAAEMIFQICLLFLLLKMLVLSHVYQSNMFIFHRECIRGAKSLRWISYNVLHSNLITSHGKWSIGYVLLASTSHIKLCLLLLFSKFLYSLNVFSSILTIRMTLYDLVSLF